MEHRKPGPMEIAEIMTRLPHRYPMLLVDRILEVEPGRRIVGLKNVSANEPFFLGHFPGHPVMPGVLIVEAMAQVGGVLASFVPGTEGRLAFFAGIDRARFRRPVRPGDQLITEAMMVRIRDPIGKVQVTGRVNGVVAAEGLLTYSMVDLRELDQILSGKVVSVEEADGDPG